MTTFRSSEPSSDPADREAIAASWLSRRDRGLSPEEQVAFDAWLGADAGHAEAFRRLERAWAALDPLRALRPEGGQAPDPDLLAPVAPRPVLRRHPILVSISVLAGTLAAALALAWVFASRAPIAGEPVAAVAPTAPAAAPAATAAPEVAAAASPVPATVGLPDGSSYRLQDDATIEIAFGDTERLVRLVRGSASFVVAKDPRRPFVVEVGGVRVQAVGTVFSVDRGSESVAVAVDEGSVKVWEPHPAGTDRPAPLTLAAGDRVVVRYARLIPMDESRRRRAAASTVEPTP